MQLEISNTRPHPHCVSQLEWLWRSLFIKKLGRSFNKNDIGVIAEKKEKYISFNVKINVKLAGVKYKDGTEVCKNIQLRFKDS